MRRFEGSFNAPGASKRGPFLEGCTINTSDLICGRDRMKLLGTHSGHYRAPDKLALMPKGKPP